MEDDKLEIKTPFGSLNGRVKVVSEIISIMALCVTGILAYAFYSHGVQAAQDSFDLKSQLVSNQVSQQKSLDALSNAMTLSMQEQRFQTCILSLPQEKREREYNSPNGVCIRMSR